MTTRPAIRDLKGYLTPAEIEKAIMGCDNLRDRLIIRLLYRSGVRVSELCQLRASNILWEDRMVIIRALKKRGEVYRRIRIDDETLRWVKAWLKGRGLDSPLVFPYTRQYIWLIVRRAFERVGIKEVGDPMVSKRRHPHPHHLRHSLAIQWVKATGGNYTELAKLQRQLGHASISTTASYLNFADKELSDSYDKVMEETDGK